MKRFKPILFSTAMIQAILNGTKTQTRRIIKSNHESGLFQVCKRVSTGEVTGINSLGWDEENVEKDVKPKAFIDDIFWVRETWAEMGNFAGDYYANSEVVGYKTEEAFFWQDGNKLDTTHWNWDMVKWKPSIFMPKPYCRIFLKVTNVRVERLKDISEEDAKAEGVQTNCPHNFDSDKCSHFNCLNGCDSKDEYWDYMDLSGETFPKFSAKESFFSLWESINGKLSLDSDPWVWVYDFEVIEKPEGFY